MKECITWRDVECALAGDEAAAERLVDVLAPVVKARVAQCLLQHSRTAQHARIDALTEDLTQEVFLSLFQNGGRVLRSWEPDRGLGLDRFVGLVAERQVLSTLRRKRHSPWTEEPSPDLVFEKPANDSGPEDRAMSRDLLRRVLTRFQQELSPQGWHIFQLLFVRQLTVEEVGQHTGLQRDAIYAWRSRLRRLARRLSEQVGRVSNLDLRLLTGDERV